MAKTSAKEPVQVLFFYELVYKDRLNWTGHYIPISYYDKKTGFYMEGYLDKVSSPTVTELGEETEKTVPVTSALLPILFPAQYEIYPSNIFPTNRKVYDTVSKSYQDPIAYKESGLVFEKKQTKFNLNNIKSFFIHYPGVYFSVDYLCAAFNNNNKKNLLKILSSELFITTRIHCIMTAEETDGYMLNTNTLRHSYTESLDELKSDYTDCTNCQLGLSRSNDKRPVIFSKGPDQAEIMVIGEAPGMQEETNKEPFYSGAPAGGALKKVIEAAGLDYNSIHFTNSVLCRPLPGEDSKSQNGKPTVASINACNSRLKNQIRIVSPKVVVLLGSYAYKAFTGKTLGSILNNVGWQEGISDHYKVYLAEHPSYIVRQLSNYPQDSNKIKSDYLNHWKLIKQKINE